MSRWLLMLEMTGDPIFEERKPGLLDFSTEAMQAELQDVLADALG